MLTCYKNFITCTSSDLTWYRHGIWKGDSKPNKEQMMPLRTLWCYNGFSGRHLWKSHVIVRFPSLTFRMLPCRPLSSEGDASGISSSEAPSLGDMSASLWKNTTDTFVTSCFPAPASVSLKVPRQTQLTTCPSLACSQVPPSWTNASYMSPSFFGIFSDLNWKLAGVSFSSTRCNDTDSSACFLSELCAAAARIYSRRREDHARQPIKREYVRLTVTVTNQSED